jgi:hypothetical protein
MDDLNGGSICARGQTFFSLNTGSGVHPVSTSVGVGDHVTGL